jgi:pilus assembly protein Flp/PilA
MLSKKILIKITPRLSFPQQRVTRAHHLKHFINLNEYFRTTATRCGQIVAAATSRGSYLPTDYSTKELSVKNLITRFVKDESGPSAIEYGLIAALISVVCIVAMTAVGTHLNVVYTTISTALAGA